MQSLIVASCVLSLAGCGSASGPTTSETSSTAAPTLSTLKPTAAAGGETQMMLGVNLNTPDIWQGTRPFMNLIYGTSWQMQNTAPWGPSEDVPAANLDANGWVKMAPAGYRVLRGLSVPAAGGDFICRYQGNGNLSVASGPASNVSASTGVLKFTIAATNPADLKGVTLAYNVDPGNYLRNLDCREAGASTSEVIAPEFLASLQGFSRIRFVKWSTAELNPGKVTWATRTKPGDGQFTQVDLVPVEYIVEAANKANADPWVNIPWNADDDYITRYATYVRDNMAAGHKVYVETSNEVWNGGYPVYAQACAEAKSEALPGLNGGLGCAGERYSERVRQVMAIWTSVFSGQSSRLVRVFAFQHVQPYWSDKLLSYQEVYKYVDALATAPYFGHEANAWSTGQSLDAIMDTLLPSTVAPQVQFGVEQKAVAQKFGLQYVTYEAGQHVVMPNNLPLLTQIERDPRMYGIYKQFLTSWKTSVGSDLTMFALTGNISQFGAWGMSEYANQPITETPKRRAVQEFLGLTTATPTPTPTPTTTPTDTTTSSPSPPIIVAATQVCPDGSTIDITATCPTALTRKGFGKGGKKA